MQTFWGTAIKTLREEPKLSQRTLATMAEVNRSTLRKIENGTAPGEIAVIERLLWKLGYDLEAIQRARARILRCKEILNLSINSDFIWLNF